MTPSELKALINSELREYLPHEGMALYSSLEALNQNGKFYILGYNPANKGGNYTNLADEKFKERSWNAYYDQCWHENDEISCPDCTDTPKLKRFQKNLQQLIRSLHDCDNTAILRDTFATNAFFLATAKPKCLGDRERRKMLWAKHWNIHRRFLASIQPEYIIALGYGEQDSAYSLLRETLGVSVADVTRKDQAWKTFRVPSSFCAEIGKKEPCHVVGLYHPSWRSNQDAAWRDFLAHDWTGRGTI